MDDNLREQIAYEVAKAQTSGCIWDVVDVVIEFMAQEARRSLDCTDAEMVRRPGELRALKRG